MKTDHQILAKEMLETVWAADGVRMALDRHLADPEDAEGDYIIMLESSLKVIIQKQLELAERYMTAAEG